MKRKVNSSLAFLIMFFILYQSHSQVLLPQWYFQLGGKGFDQGIKIIVDPAENIYFAGTFENQAYVSNGGLSDTIISYGQEDIYFGKIKSNGQLLWSKHIGGIGVDNPTDLIMNNQGNVFLSGIFEDSLFIDHDTLISQDYVDSFIAKFDSYGNIIWIKQISSIGYQQCSSLMCDLQGNLLTGGYFTKSILFPSSNSGQYDSEGDFDGFLAKWNTQGSLLWVKLIPGTGRNTVNDVLMDNFNDYYITGEFTDSVLIDSTQGMMYSQGKTDVYLAKYDNNGNSLWCKAVGGVHDDISKCLTWGENGKIIMIGEFKENLFYNNHLILSASGGDDIFQLTFDKHGNLQNHKKQGLEKNDFVFDAWLPVGQKILMTSDLKTLEGNQTVTLASYGLSGDLNEIIQTADNFNPIILSSVMPNPNEIIFCGRFSGEVSFGELSLNSRGDQDLFLLKMGSNSENQSLNSLDSSEHQFIGDITSDYQFFTNNDSLPIDVFYNFPNPFTSKTKIIYSIPSSCSVILQIYNTQGSCLKKWEFSEQTAGLYSVDFKRLGFQTGTYYCQLILNRGNAKTLKMLKMVIVD